MNWQNIWQLANADYWKLLLILGLAFYIAFIPHQNYSYAVHIDEWVHMARSEAMVQASSLTITGPFNILSSIGLGSNLEIGFDLFWGVFHQISGISWITIFRYFPSVVFMLTVLSVYVMAKREGFGWEAALFTCLIPTTVGILGPAFLVPVAMGLPFIPLSLFLVFNFRTWWSYLVLLIFTSFLLSAHPPTAVGLAIVLIPYIVLNLKGNFKHSLGTILALAIAFLAPFPWIFKMLLPAATSLFNPQPVPTWIELPYVIRDYGYIPISFCLLGIFLLFMRGGKKNYGLIFSLLALLVMLVAAFSFHYGSYPLYTRGLIYMMLMLGIIAGAGLMGVRTFSLPSKLTLWLRPLLSRNMGNILCLVLIGVTLAIYIPNRQEIPYYHMIDEEDYQAFVWIRDNVNDNYEKAVLDPWKATAFTAITQKPIYTKIHAYPKPSDIKAYKFLEGGCADTAFLRENEIAIVYTRLECNNPDLKELKEFIYVLE